MEAPTSRVARANDHPIREDGRYVVYWMIAQRRTRWNFGLQQAVHHARRLGKPLVVVEALSASYRWASDRFHAFVIDGMRDNRDTLGPARVTYHPYVEPKAGAGDGLHAALAKEACLYVTDHWPCFHLPHWVRKVAGAIDCRMETVDSCGILPVAATDKAYARAFDFRRHVHREAFTALQDVPLESPLKGPGLEELDALPSRVTERWPTTDLDALDLADLPIDHDVQPVEGVTGGETAGRAVLDRFIEERLARYTQRNHPDEDVASGLSPWLHWGHVSAHEVFQRVADVEGWSPNEIEGQSASGKRAGWWGMSEDAEAFVDELVTWRETCFNAAQNRPDDYDAYASLPDFAKKTLAEHADDERPRTYTLEEFERAETHDDLWNAAQRQLVRDGIIHNYLRMLWGKKILHWSESPREAFRIMEELNNKYGLDGRDPNSYGGILWVLGRYDRAWGPEREIFGKVRYMTSDNTKRKVRLKQYMEQYGASKSLF